MCGIAGILHYHTKRPIDPNSLKLMGQSISHRGPDAANEWLEENVGLAHRRLSILDLTSSGIQPFHSLDGRFVITYNGEIYNFNEFRGELQSKGYTFISTSDTEVLLYLFVAYGFDMLHRLNGMFAFAIWDRKEKILVLCRDRLGVKPLYYTEYAESLYFASEPKALFSAGVPAEINESQLDEFLLYRYNAGEGTLYHNVKRLLPGHYAVIKDGKIELNRWWNLSNRVKNHNIIRQPIEWFDSTFLESVRYRMVSEVPVGVLLSGGMDSSSILSALHRQGIIAQSFNIGFNDPEHDESSLASSFTKSIGYPFHTLSLEKNDLLKSIDDSIWYLDEPLVHHNDPHLLHISRYAKQFVTVLLSGEGSDEFMAGYVRYKTFRFSSLFPILRLILPFAKGIGVSNRILKLLRYLEIPSLNQMQLLNASNLFPKDFERIGFNNMQEYTHYRTQILNEARSLYPNNALRQTLYLDQHTYICSLLDRNDRSTMGAGIECREPFLDYRLIEGLGTLPMDWLDRGTRGKYLLFQAMKSHLPREILQHKKIGLSVPWNTYFLDNEAIVSRLHEMEKGDVFDLGILRSISIKHILANFRRQPDQWGAIVGQLFMLHSWYQNYFMKISELKNKPNS